MTDSAYWNEFYRTSMARRLDAPSQFAVFVLSEAEDLDAVVDIGCGSGRDSLFFMSQGKRTISVDASQAGIDLCLSLAEEHGLKSGGAVCSSVDAPDLAQRISGLVPTGPTVVYARFFVHAINEAQEDAFLKLASEIMGAGGMLAVEFRTPRDASQAKVTPDHYRRFVSPLAFMAKAQAMGMSCSYFVEGFGYAKFRNDDAHVARCIFRKN